MLTKLIVGSVLVVIIVIGLNSLTRAVQVVDGPGGSSVVGDYCVGSGWKQQGNTWRCPDTIVDRVASAISDPIVAKLGSVVNATKENDADIVAKMTALNKTIESLQSNTNVLAEAIKNMEATLSNTTANMILAQVQDQITREIEEKVIAELCSKGALVGDLCQS